MRRRGRPGSLATCHQKRLAQRLFVNRDGHVAPEPWSVEAAAGIVAPVPALLDAVNDLVALLEQAPLLPPLAVKAARRADLMIALS